MNLAVNNLLSRDDNDPDDEGEDYIQEAYLPSGKRCFFISSNGFVLWDTLSVNVANVQYCLLFPDSNFSSIEKHY